MNHSFQLGIFLSTRAMLVTVISLYHGWQRIVFLDNERVTVLTTFWHVLCSWPGPGAGGSAQTAIPTASKSPLSVASTLPLLNGALAPSPFLQLSKHCDTIIDYVYFRQSFLSLSGIILP